MGSGRLLQIGPLTFRMILFLIAMYYSIVLLIMRSKIDIEINLLLVFFIVIHSLAVFIGIFNGAEISLVLNDIKPMLFFFMIIYFYMVIKDKKSVHITIKTVKISALILTVSYLIVVSLLFFEIIDIKSYILLTSFEYTQEFASFETHFFYNGFLYLCIGFVFYFLDKNNHSKFIAGLIMTAIFLTFSRGLLLSTLSVIFIYLIFWFKRSIKTSIILISFISAILLLASTYIDVVGDKYASNLIRINTFDQVMDAINLSSFFVGHGFGIGVLERPVRMENSYLEIFHKQGILGLLFWFILFYIIIKKYFRASKNGNRDMALPFMLSSLLVFIQTMFNPFLNNPIGMSMILVSIAVLNILGNNNYESSRTKIT